MTEPVDPTVKFGPGVLKIGATGSEIDASCYVNGFQIECSPNREDSRTMLCGTVRAGATTFDYQATGNLDLDLDAGAEGLFALSQENPGSEQPFEFTPNEVDGTTATGRLLLDPMTFGSDAYGNPMASDVTWILLGKPTYTYHDGATAATGATAGSPGSWTPAGATAPANLAACTGITASPSTAWSTGQHVITGDTQHVHWSGSAWAAGDAT